MVKKLGIAALVLIAILGGALYYLYMNAGGIIKSAIEHFGSEATQTSVRLSSVKLSPSSGEGSLNGLRIGNPAGYSGGDALDLGSIDMKVNPQSVLGTGPIVIREVAIDGPMIAYEHNISTSNLDVLRKNVMGYAARLSRAGGGGSASSPSGGQSRKVIIDNLYVRNGKVAISDALLNGAALSADLPTIHLSNIGRARGGATQAEVAQQILSVITGSAIEVGAGALTKKLGNLGGAVGKVMPGTSGVTGSVKGLFGH